MNLYLLEQDAVDGYDTYDSCVVAAATEFDARQLHPGHETRVVWKKNDWWARREDGSEYDICRTWSSPEQVKVTLLGVAAEGTEAGVICASFNAG